MIESIWNVAPKQSELQYMRVVFFGKGTRGSNCLQALLNAGWRPELVVSQPVHSASMQESLSKKALALKLKTIEPEDPNDETIIKLISSLKPDLLVLAGYGKILDTQLISLASKMCINLHAGSVPAYRGSSPLNWSLINGEKQIGLSILKLTSGVDTGPVLAEKTFPISDTDNIATLHEIANKNFPIMLVEVLKQIENKSYHLREQNPNKASYYTLRFPDDGLILWDKLTALEVHNRVRALTKPYSGAFTFYHDLKITLLSSSIPKIDYFGEPGRVYKKNPEGILVCASDKCLLITEFTPSAIKINRYDRLLMSYSHIFEKI